MLGFPDSISLFCQFWLSLPPFFGTTTWEFAIWETCNPGWTVSLLCQPRGRGSRTELPTGCCWPQRPGQINMTIQIGNTTRETMQNCEFSYRTKDKSQEWWSFHFLSNLDLPHHENLYQRTFQWTCHPFSVSGYLPCLVCQNIRIPMDDQPITVIPIG